MSHESCSSPWSHVPHSEEKGRGRFFKPGATFPSHHEEPSFSRSVISGSSWNWHNNNIYSYIVLLKFLSKGDMNNISPHVVITTNWVHSLWESMSLLGLPTEHRWRVTYRGRYPFPKDSTGTTLPRKDKGFPPTTKMASLSHCLSIHSSTSLRPPARQSCIQQEIGSSWILGGKVLWHFPPLHEWM